MRYLASLVVLLIVMLLALPIFAGMAKAHSWYSERRDPIFSGTTCCGGYDCAPLPAHAIQWTDDGNLRIVLTLEEAKAINPGRLEPFDEVIPFERIQTAEDGRPHICLMRFKRQDDGRQGFYCIFLAPNG